MLFAGANAGDAGALFVHLGLSELAWLAAAPGVGLLAWWIIRYVGALAWTGFAGYDDEGYVLASVREFLSGKPLYQAVFSQYGPCYYLYRQVESLFYSGLPTQDTTRAGTAAMWLLTAALMGVFVWLVTRSRLMGAMVWAHTTLYLRPLMNEPGHPQELVLFLLALFLVVAALPLTRVRAAAALGIVTGAILMPKINIGIYAAFPALLTLLLLGRKPWDARSYRLMSAAAMLMPVVVMREHLSGSTLNYAAHVTLMIAAACVAASIHSSEVEVRSRNILSCVAAVAGMCVLLAAYLLFRGTSISSLLNGVLVLPLRFSNLFFIAMPMPVEAVVYSMGGCAIALMFRFSSGWQNFPGMWRAVISGLKLLAGIYILSKSAVPVEVIAYACPFVWLLLVPSERDEFSGTGWFARILLALTTVFQTLQGYPVAGSQASWSSVLVIAAAYLLIHDGAAKVLPRELGLGIPPLVRAAASGMAMLAVAILFLSRADLAGTEAWAKTLRPLGLTGAERVRVAAPHVSAYHWTTANLQAHCDGLVTMPGMYSLNLWSGLPLETGFNATDWMKLLTPGQEQAVVDAIRKKQRPCAAYAAEVAKFWLQGSFEDFRSQPLVRYIFDLTPVPSVSSFGAAEIRTTPQNARDWKLNYLLWGSQKFGRDDAVEFPIKLIDGETPITIRGWFRTQQQGSILGAQKGSSHDKPVAEWHPIAYVGTDGRLRAGFGTAPDELMTAPAPVMDGRWHHFAVTRDEEGQALYVDGNLAARGKEVDEMSAGYFELGTGYAGGFPGGTSEWMPWVGDLRNIAIAAEAWTGNAAARDMADRPN